MTYTQKSFFDQDEPSQQAVVQSNLILSGPTKVDLSVYRGDSGQFRVTVKDDVGVGIDISTMEWDADIRVKATDPTLITSFDIMPVSGDPSSIDVILTSVNSDLLVDRCVYDLEMRSGEAVTTLIYGTITVTQDVSRP